MQIFIDADQLDSTRIELTQEQYHYLVRVRRLKANDRLSVVIDKKMKYVVNILTITEKCLDVAILDKENWKMKTSLLLTLVQSCPKQDKFSDVVNHATQCGVTNIIPIITERTIVHYTQSQSEKRLQRWRKVAEVSANQTGLLECPQVEPIFTFKEFFDAYNVSDYDLALVAWEESDVLLKTILEKKKTIKNCIFFVGPEGGLSQNEVTDLVSHGFKPMSLGRTIFRTELASTVVASQINFYFS